jgi:hypothetical protein
MKKKNLLLLIIGFLFIVSNSSVSAVEIDNVRTIFIYTDESEKERVNDIEISEITSDIEQLFVAPLLISKVSPIFSAEVWMKVSSTWGGTPALNRYWYVEYLSGRKYQGYVYWTGDKKISSWGPPIQMLFKFRGTLNLA